MDSGTLTTGPEKKDVAYAPETVDPADEAAAPRGAALDRTLVGGVKWTALVQWISQILSWAGTVIVARLLTPADFGIVGMATVYSGFSSLVTEFGLGSAIVLGRQRFDRAQLAQLNGLALRNGLLAFATSCLAAWPLARFFHAPPLTAIVIVLGVGFILETLRLVPSALLRRELQFKRLAFYEGIRLIAATVIQVALAYAGFRYWSLVVGNLIGSAVTTALVMAHRPLPFHRTRSAELRDALTLSRTLLLDRASWYLFSNTDFIVAGRVIGSAALGAYSYAWQLASLPGTKVLALVQRVTPSVFSAVKDDPAALRRYLLVLSESLSALIFPVAIGVGLVADDFVHVLLGSQWGAAVLPLRLLAMYAAANMVMTQLPLILQVTGHEVWAMRWSVSRLIVLPAVFYVAGRRWGIDGIALSWVIVYPWFLAVLAWRTLRVVAMPAREYLASFWPALSATLVMAGAVLLAHRAFPADTPRALRMAVDVSVGAAAYLAVALTVHRGKARALATFWRTGQMPVA